MQEFLLLKEKEQENILKLYPVFPSGTTYNCKPTLDQFLQFVKEAKKVGYSMKRLWGIYSGWNSIPLELHAIAIRLSELWTKEKKEKLKSGSMNQYDQLFKKH